MAFALAVIAVLLAVVVALEAGAFGARWWSPAPAAAPKAAPSAEAKLIPPLASVNPDQAYPESSARPPFSPTRRPAPPPVQQASAMARGQFTLMGIIAIGNQRTALLREKSNGRVHRVERGKEVNGLMLAAIENDHVTLAQGGEQELLQLQVQRGPAVAAAPAAAAPVTAGPFAPPPGPTPAAVAAGAAPQPPAAAPVPAQAAGAPVPPQPNPAARSGFGPYAQPTPAAAEPAATTMTPEELLARRRARRAQQQEGNQR